MNEDGGITYGSLYEPTETGSSGGEDKYGYPGARGGGRIRIRVGGVFDLDGNLNADGFAGSDIAGGGSGGSVWITTSKYHLTNFDMLHRCIC